MQTATIIYVSTTEIGTEELRTSSSTIFGRFLFGEEFFIIIFISDEIFVVFHDNIEDIICDIKLILDTDFASNRRHVHLYIIIYINLKSIFYNLHIFNIVMWRIINIYM
jgi:hypothetical protein